MNLSGNIFDYFIVFGWGVLASFTPCLYPVLPLTASYIGGVNTKGTKYMGFILSLLYVFGLALTYSTLGIFASLTGKVFGQVQNSPFVYLIAACFFMFFSLVMFEIFHLPSFGAGIQTKIKLKNIWSVVLFGMASGLVVGSCLSPVLGGLLFYVASKENIFYGASLLFVFSYGLGTSLILVGTFSGLLSNLPKSGSWLIRVKKFCASILFLSALYFAYKAVMSFLL